MKLNFKLLSKSLLTVVISIFLFSGGAVSQNLNPADWPNLKGYWNFQDTSNLLDATVGSDLILVGQHQWVAGAFYGDTAIRIDTGSYYKCHHGIAPNGGGDSVNQYSLMFDFKVLSLNLWHCFYQTDSTNSNDGECFIKHIGDSIPGTIGVGYTGYSSDSILPEIWYRLVITVNNGTYYNYYLNGALLHIGDTDDLVIDNRFALTPEILFFADNNNEDDTIDIASIAIFDTCLSPTQIAQLGTIDPCIANPPLVDLGGDTTLCWNHVFNVGVGTGYKSVLWSTGDTVASIALDTANFGIGTDTLWVKVIDMNDCYASDTISVSFQDCSGIIEHSQNPQPIIFPNPNAGKFTLILSQAASKVSVMNSEGRIVKGFNSLNVGTYKINLSELPDGLYFVVITGKDYVSRDKILIVK